MSHSITNLWATGRSLLSGFIQTADSLLDPSPLNNFFSGLASLPGAIFGHTTVSNLDKLSDTTPIAAPHHQNLSHSPTLSQFLNVANAEYTIAGTPQGMTPFLVGGRQLAITDEVTGMSAKVWETNAHQVIVGFQGTSGGDNALLNPVAVATGVVTDLQVWNQTVSLAQKDALGFTHYVVDQAQQRGIDTNNIFVTGHSLGGIEASYVGQQTGLGGVAFESTGIPGSPGAVGNGSNFVSIVTAGDPVGNYATDTEGHSPFVTSLPPGANGDLNHYGKVISVGSAQDNVALDQKLAGWGQSTFGNVATLAEVVPDFLKYHLPGTQAADLGVTLSPHSLTADLLVTQHGPVLPIGNDTLHQLLAPTTHGLPPVGV